MAACPDRETMLQALLDGELDAAHAQDMERHLRTCTGCSDYFNSLQLLRSRLASANLSPPVPDNLRARIEASLESETQHKPALRHSEGRTPWWRGLTAAWSTAGAMTAIAASLLVVQLVPTTSTILEAQLVDSHVRSLLADHLYDVETSDRHTVKPWFNGRISFAPPVPELAPNGFPLAGGRLDYAGDKVVAAIVYRRHAHVINLFVMPHENSPAGIDPRHEGYAINRWTSGGLDFWAVSDIEPTDLETFHQAFIAASPP